MNIGNKAPKQNINRAGTLRLRCMIAPIPNFEKISWRRVARRPSLPRNNMVTRLLCLEKPSPHPPNYNVEKFMSPDNRVLGILIPEFTPGSNLGLFLKKREKSLMSNPCGKIYDYRNGEFDSLYTEYLLSVENDIVIEEDSK